MTSFDSEKFEEKYVHYFDELQEAYKNAFQHLHDRYDSEALRAIDREVLNESEPFYEGNGEFRVELPEDPRKLVQGVAIDDEQFDVILTEFTTEIEVQLRQIFGLSDTE